VLQYDDDVVDVYEPLDMEIDSTAVAQTFDCYNFSGDLRTRRPIACCCVDCRRNGLPPRN